MTTIIAGGFDHYSKAEAARARLLAAGVAEADMCDFRVNPPGEHDALPIGGDHDKSLGMKTAQQGAGAGVAVGATIGTVAGVAATPLIGPAGIVAGAAAGAYTGSLLGSLRKTEHETQPDHTWVRPAEAMLAVNAGAGSVPVEDIVRIFEECGASQVEQADGSWQDGEWADFDPVAPPQLIGGTDLRDAGSPAGTGPQAGR